MLHYNLANAMTALARYEEAIEEYHRAIALEPGDPRIWKNLGSAFHHVGDHVAEMECFDQALAIDPDHTIALVSKGVSMLIDFGQNTEAIELMTRALTLNPDLVLEWPHVWYWIAEGYHRDGQIEDAMHWIGQGLRHLPGSGSLGRLQFQVLSDAWQTDLAWADQALAHFESLVERTPLAYDARIETIQILAALGRETEAWSVLEGAFDALDHPVATQLRACGFDLADSAAALEFLPEYLQFRAQHPISDYWDLGDPLYWTDEAPPQAEAFVDALFTAGAVPFGTAYRQIRDSSDQPLTREIVVAAFEAIRALSKVGIPEAAKVLGTWISPGDGVDEISRRLTTVILFVPLLAIREVGRQQGFIASRLGIPTVMVDEALDAIGYAELQGDVLEATLMKVNQVAKIFRETGEESMSRQSPPG